MLQNDTTLLPEYRFNIENAQLTFAYKHLSPREKYVRPYWHPFYVIIAVREGRLALRIEDAECSLGAGEYAVIAPGVLHITKSTDEGADAVCLTLGITRLELDSDDKLYERLTRSLSLASGRIDRREDVLSAINAVIDKGFPDRYSALAAYSTVISLLLDSSKENRALSLRDCNTTRLNKINTIANVYYDESISIVQLAEMLHLSTRQVNRIIESVWGMSWSQLQNEKRMQVANDLITTTDMTVEEISEYVGKSPRGRTESVKTKQ